jgi:hypothetical protein
MFSTTSPRIPVDQIQPAMIRRYSTALLVRYRLVESAIAAVLF